ncbi:MAG: hypothetical protein MOB07_19150 [Acidobacteria bacterium]|nr:hypothetical protein [Acidobacteriota bacterium]
MQFRTMDELGLDLTKSYAVVFDMTRGKFPNSVNEDGVDAYLTFEQIAKRCVKMGLVGAVYDGDEGEDHYFMGDVCSLGFYTPALPKTGTYQILSSDIVDKLIG